MCAATSEKDERAELDKYVKFFCAKIIELLHCSRKSNLNAITQTVDSNSRPWFNIQLPEASVIAKDAKRALDKQLPSSSIPLIVQVSIIPAANKSASVSSPSSQQQKTVIEAWKISYSDEVVNQNVKLITGVYTKLAGLLKSVITVSRCTPAYKLCRSISKRGGTEVDVCVEYFFGQISSSLLNGECEKPRRLGSVQTPFGVLSVCVLCKTVQQIEHIFYSFHRYSDQNLIAAATAAASKDVDGRQPHRTRESSVDCNIVNDNAISHPKDDVIRFPITAAFAVKSNSDNNENNEGLLLEKLFANKMTTLQNNNLADHGTSESGDTCVYQPGAAMPSPFSFNPFTWPGTQVQMLYPNSKQPSQPTVTSPNSTCEVVKSKQQKQHSSAATISCAAEPVQPAFVMSPSDTIMGLGKRKDLTSAAFSSAVASDGSNVGASAEGEVLRGVAGTGVNEEDDFSDFVETDVNQFFKIVQQAASLRTNQPPQEGQVISHDMQLGDYVTSFNEIGDELKKLVYNFD